MSPGKAAFRFLIYTGCTLAFVFAVESASLAAPSSASKKRTAPAAKATEPEKLQKQYWDKGDLDLRIMQDRPFKKAGRLELGGFYGSSATDPFLAIKQMGGSLAFYFSESWALKGLYWVTQVTSSTAQEMLEQTDSHSTANTNPPKSFMGGELVYAPVYGKLSLFGSAIIHYDMHVSFGAGLMSTQRGTFPGPVIGIGQHFFLQRWLALGADYRYLFYSETIPVRGGEQSRTMDHQVINLNLTLWIGSST